MRVFQGSDGNPSGPHADAALADAVRLLSLVADAGEGHPAQHGARVASVAVVLAKAGGLSDDDLAATYYAGLLHEVGSLAIGPTHARSDAPLARSAMVAMWDHPAQGARICARIGALPARTADLVRWHHESWDGTGYPDQLRWNAIPKAAQYLRVADAFVSMLAPRPFREPRGASDAYSEILTSTGRDFSPAAVRVFGTCFRMQEDELSQLIPPPGEPLSAAHTLAAEVLTLLGELIDNRLQNPGRSARISELATRVAEQMNISAEDRSLLAQAGPLLEIGTVTMSLEAYSNVDVLSGLMRTERAKSAVLAAEILGQAPSFAPLAAIVRAQYEWFDGSGAPDRLSANAIPLAARILCACAAFDSLERVRILRPLERGEPRREIEAAAGMQFDPAVVRALLACVPAPA